MAERNWLEKILQVLIGEPESTFGGPVQYGVPVPGAGGAIRGLGPMLGPGTGASRAIVPRPSYQGVRVTGGTSIVPRDPGWRYGGPNWRPFSQGGNFTGAQARQARSVARGASDPTRALVPRAGSAISPANAAQFTPRGTSLVPLSGQGRSAINYPGGILASNTVGQGAQAAARGAQVAGAAGAAGISAEVIRRLLEDDIDSGGSGPVRADPDNRAIRSLADRNREENIDNPGLSDWSNVPGVVGQQEQSSDPYDDFLQEQLDALASSYDAQMDAIGGLSGSFRDYASSAQDNIGGFFGYAEEAARGAMPVTEEIYGTAQENVGSIYDTLASSLDAIPQQMTNIASQAAGGAVGSSVAGGSAESVAPFRAAGETSRASAQTNLQQSSAAGQNYLNNLAAAVPAEGALHQSAVEQALNQQLQLVAHRQAELEGAKQRAMIGLTSDLAGSSAEQMANQALAHALGIDVPFGVDPGAYLLNLGRIQGLEGGQVTQAQKEFNFQQSVNPANQREQIEAGLSVPAQKVFPEIMRLGHSAAGEREAEGRKVDSNEMIRLLLDELDAYAAPLETGSGTQRSLFEQRLGNFGNTRLGGGAEGIREELRRAIERLVF
jgi:hypothetical protein